MFKTLLLIYLYTPKTSFVLCHHFCAFWHCLISNNDQCETSSFIQTNALILSIFDCLICSLSAEMSEAALNPQSRVCVAIRLRYTLQLRSWLVHTWKISTLNVTAHHSRHKSDSPQTFLATCSAVTHCWSWFPKTLFNQIVPGTKKPYKINLLKVPFIHSFLCFLRIERTMRIRQIRPISD